MKLTEQQGFMLLAVLRDTCNIEGIAFGNMTSDIRFDLYKSIIAQQNDQIIDLKGEE